MIKKEPQEQTISINRLKLNILPKDCKIDGVYDALKKKYQSDDNSKLDNADHQDDDGHIPEPNRQFNFSDVRKKTVENTIYYITTCQCRFITSSVVDDKKDDVNGDMTFFYWEEDESIKLYAIVRSGKSNTWALLRSYRDCQFPKQFAQTFLNPKSIKKTNAFYLTGKHSGTSEATYANTNKFDPYDITCNYGVVETLKAEILTDGDGKTLKDMCNLGSTKHYVNILAGQVNLTVKDCDDDSRFKLLKFIDASISNKDITLGINWQFLTYIHRVYDVKTKVSSKILKELSQMYRNDTDESPSLDLNSSLIHVHQGVFDNANSVSVLYKGDIIPWADDNKQCKGENISVKDIVHAIKKKLRPEEDPDFNAVKVCFFNTIIGEKETTQLTEFLASQTIFENEHVFQLGTHYYTVETDTFLDTTTRFANAVSNTIVSDEEKQDKPFPQIIPWCTKNGNILPSFKIDTLLQHAMINKEQIESKDFREKADKLSKLLTTKLLRPLSADDSTNPTNDLLRDKIQGISTEHDKDLLGVNLSLLPESVFAKSILKAAKKKQKGFLSIIRDILIDSHDEKTIRSKLGEVTDKKDKTILDDIIKEFEKIIPCLVRDEVENSYSVHSPYITKYLLEQIEKTGLKLCPARLIQFLRMHIPMDEEDYNELYRLSNCKCGKSEWKYIVGDQIFDMDSDHVELFDVMAYNKSKKITYLLHVKKDFKADAFRAVCSQVRVSGDEVWKSITVNSKTNAFDKFFTCASKESQSFRRKLTKKEVKRYIAPTNEAFIDAMLDCDMQFYICLATCLPKGNNLTQVNHCNLNYKFCANDFPSGKEEILKRLKDIGMIDKKFLTITGKCFGTKQQFIERVLSEQASISKTWAIEACDKIFLETCKGRDSLLVSGSFVAKVSLIDLHRTFSDYYNAYGITRVKLRILEIDDISRKNKKTSICSQAKPENPVLSNPEQQDPSLATIEDGVSAMEIN